MAVDAKDIASQVADLCNKIGQIPTSSLMTKAKNCKPARPCCHPCNIAEGSGEPAFIVTDSNVMEQLSGSYSTKPISSSADFLIGRIVHLEIGNPFIDLDNHFLNTGNS